MLQYLGRLLALHSAGIAVHYLSKTEDDTCWKDGLLVAIDPQGLVLETCEDRRRVAECLPWASLGALRIALGDDG